MLTASETLVQYGIKMRRMRVKMRQAGDGLPACVFACLGLGE